MRTVWLKVHAIRLGVTSWQYLHLFWVFFQPLHPIATGVTQNQALLSEHQPFVSPRQLSSLGQNTAASELKTHLLSRWPSKIFKERNCRYRRGKLICKCKKFLSVQSKLHFHTAAFSRKNEMLFYHGCSEMDCDQCCSTTQWVIRKTKINSKGSSEDSFIVYSFLLQFSWINTRTPCSANRFWILASR